MWTSVIIMANPLSQNCSQMFLTERDHEVQAFPSHRPDQSLTICVGLRCPYRCSQNFHTQSLNRLIDSLCKNAVAVMDQQPITIIARNGFAELLRGPFCRR